MVSNSPIISDEREELRVFSNSNLVGKISEGFYDKKKWTARRQYLVKENIFFHEWVTKKSLEDYTSDLFERFEKFKEQGAYLEHQHIGDNQEALDVYERISELLIISGVSELITAGDWSVNRMLLAEKSHWLQEEGFHKLQTTLAQKYEWDSVWEKPIHLHKWPGNGILPRYLMKVWEDDQVSWQQLWIGDKLYFPLENILYKFVKERYHDEENIKVFVDILSTILKLRLKNRWFQADTASIGKWKSKTAFCNLNDIFSELEDFSKNPTEDILNLFNPNTGKIKSSEQFEFDSSKELTLNVQGILLRLLWRPKNETVVMMLKGLYKKLQREKKPLRHRIESLRIIKNKLKKNKWGQNITDIMLREISYFSKKHIQPQKSDISEPWYRDRLINYIEDHILELVWVYDSTSQALKKWTFKTEDIDVEQITNRVFRNNIGIFEDDFTSEIFFKDIFTQDFFGKIFDDDNNRGDINLNRESVMYFWDFSQWYFTEIPDVIPQHVHLISATRSDSHENDEQFEEDIYNNLKKLAPGWVITTDGMKASFSCIYRFHEITQALKKCGEDNFKAEVVVDTITRRAISVFIQKKYPKWYLTDDEKKSFFSTNIEFETLGETLSRPYIKVVNKVRRNLLDITRVEENDETSVDIFEKLQRDVKENTEAILIDVAVEAQFENDKETNQEPYICMILEFYNKIVEFLKDKSVRPNSADALLEYITENREEFWEDQYLCYDSVLIWLLREYRGQKISDDPYEERLSALYIMHSSEENNIETKDDYIKFLRQQIRDNKNTQVLSTNDIDEVAKRVSEKVEASLHKYKWKVAPHMKKSLKRLDKWSVNIYASPKIPISQTNRSFHSPLGKLSNNWEFLWLQNKLEWLIWEIRTRVGTFRKKISTNNDVKSFKPICFLSYDDCITNQFMLKELNRIFWEAFVERNVEIINLWFREWEEVSPDMIRHINRIQQKMAVYHNYGGIIIWGGSWTDAYDNFGMSFKKYIGYDLLDAIESNPKLKQFAICASYQIMADMIWTKYFWDRIETVPGMMQMWAANIWLMKHKTRGLIRHEVFRDFPEYFTSAMTHTWWVQDFRKQQWRQQVNIFDPIAVDTETWNIAAYTAMNDQIIAAQWHPEINMKNPETLERLDNEFEDLRAVFEDNFDVWPGTVMHNFYGPTKGKKPIIKEDSWEYVLVYALEYLSRWLAA